MLTLVVGGIRAGKTRLAGNRAEALAAAARDGRPFPVAYVATYREAGAEARLDAEMRRRLARHRADRPAGWMTVEAGEDLAVVCEALAPRVAALVVDELSLAVAGWLSEGWSEEAVEAQLARCLDAWRKGPAHVVVVSHEVGWGGVAADPLARRFADAVGFANQRVAEAAEEVVQAVAGLPVKLK